MSTGDQHVVLVAIRMDDTTEEAALRGALTHRLHGIPGLVGACVADSVPGDGKDLACTIHARYTVEGESALAAARHLYDLIRRNSPDDIDGIAIDGDWLDQSILDEWDRVTEGRESAHRPAQPAPRVATLVQSALDRDPTRPSPGRIARIAARLRRTPPADDCVA